MQKLVELAHAILQQVGKTGSAVLEQRERVRLVGVLREDDDADVGMLCADCVGRLDALHVVAGRHPDVCDDGVRLEGATTRLRNSSAVPTVSTTTTSPESSSSRRIPSRTM